MVRRPSSRAKLGQWLLLVVVVAVAWLLVSNAGDNLARRNLSFGFGFFGDRANFDIPFKLISWSESDTFGRALLVCLLNTVLVAGLSVASATLLGVVVGIMRLSVNWLVRNIALAFVEFIRNTPQLIQIIFWYVAVLQTLPSPRQSIVLPFGMLLNIRGFYLPNPVPGSHSAILTGLAIALLVATPFPCRCSPPARTPLGSTTSAGRSSRASTSPEAFNCRPSWSLSGPGLPFTRRPSSPRWSGARS